MRDEGHTFDPNSRCEPDITVPLELRPPGGMGVLMIKHLTDEFDYHRTPDGCNELIMVKRDALK